MNKTRAYIYTQLYPNRSERVHEIHRKMDCVKTVAIYMEVSKID